MASQFGLEDVTIGELAKEMDMSKSGIFGHFHSKENLQLLIIRYAVEQFVECVLKPTIRVRRGIPRIKASVQNWRKWEEGLAGGCVFVSAGNEFCDRPGPVRLALISHQREWLKSLERFAESAIKCGDFRDNIDTAQFAFEIYSLILGFHYYSRMLEDKDTIEKQDKALDKLISNYI